MFYNIRDSLGRFSKQKVQAPSTVPQTVVAGRLYDYRGSVVRAGRMCNNGKRHVSFHKQLHGFVEDQELRLINKNRVQQYLTLA